MRANADRIQKKNPILKEEVSEEDIAAVVARWTGIPVSKMLKSEKAKLAQTEKELTAQLNAMLAEPLIQTHMLKQFQHM